MQEALHAMLAMQSVLFHLLQDKEIIPAALLQEELRKARTRIAERYGENGGTQIIEALMRGLTDKDAEIFPLFRG